MVVLTIVTHKNGETIFFDQAIQKVHFIKLISCSLFNSWLTFKDEGSLSLPLSTGNLSVSKKFPQGHYTLDALAKEIKELTKKLNLEISADTYSPLGQLVLMNHSKNTLLFEDDLSNFLGTSSTLKSNEIAFIRYIKQPAYFIHCDLIDRNFNFFNNKKSDLLAKIDVKGKPYEKVRYDASPQQPIRDCSTSEHVNSITISVRDENGELFDFKNMPLEFELELN